MAPPTAPSIIWLPYSFGKLANVTDDEGEEDRGMMGTVSGACLLRRKKRKVPMSVPTKIRRKTAPMVIPDPVPADKADADDDLSERKKNVTTIWFIV